MLPNWLKVSCRALLSIVLSRFLMKMLPTPDCKKGGRGRWVFAIGVPATRACAQAAAGCGDCSRSSTRLHVLLPAPPATAAFKACCSQLQKQRRCAPALPGSRARALTAPPAAAPPHLAEGRVAVRPHDADGPAADRVVVERLQRALGWGMVGRAGVRPRGRAGVRPRGRAGRQREGSCSDQHVGNWPARCFGRSRRPSCGCRSLPGPRRTCRTHACSTLPRGRPCSSSRCCCPPRARARCRRCRGGTPRAPFAS